MEIFSYLAAFLLVLRIRKSLKFSSLRAKWTRTLSLALWSSIAMYVLAIIFLPPLSQLFIGSFLLAAFVFFAGREADFSILQAFFKAHYPLIAVTLLAGLVWLIKPDFYDSQGRYFDWAMVAAFIWIFASWATNKRQQDEFKKVSQQNLVLDSLVAQRTAELTKQKNELQDTLALLQTTQQQLIQSEKLASLGELTAGIAHEIQNPLNFVNNFSEVNMELLDEMEQELTKGDKKEAVAIAGDIKQNLKKIIHHGRRADGIVKGMLQHSRASSHTKEAADINKLADEYLRLAYHGLRAKEKAFNAEMITHFDENLPSLNVVQQDIGRVLLNLFNNAFYAINQKVKTAGPEYKPEVSVTTALENGHIIIKVKDNGIGISDSIKDKIMQPFFTTKPTGEGTGLGLSLSYDIVVKGHGGKIDVITKDGEYTKFIIKLPVAQAFP